MARRRDPVEPPTRGRPFTPAELDRIRELTAQALPYGSPHAHKQAQEILAELESIHAEAGRPLLAFNQVNRRGFMLWELGGGEHDPQAASAEEVAGGFYSWQDGRHQG